MSAIFENRFIPICRHVSWDEYADRFFPPFCTGPSYIITAYGIERMLGATQDVNLIWVRVPDKNSNRFGSQLEDVMLTGVLAEAANVSRLAPLGAFQRYPWTPRRRCAKTTSGARALLSMHGYEVSLRSGLP